MKLKLSRTAAKQIKKLPKAGRLKVFRKLDRLKQDPLAGKKLRGQLSGSRSLKVWPYRIVYVYSLKRKLVIIKTVQHRQGVYS